MPLIQSKSKKAFSKNVETEMKSGKPQDQALAISYSVKRKPKKKMAEGGEVNAKNERRPMPDNTYDDTKMTDRNSGNKPPKNDSWTDTPGLDAAQKPSKSALKHPKMVPQNVYSVRLRDEEDDLQSSASPGPYDAKPKARHNEDGADRQGPAVPDMASQHNNGDKPYNKAIEDQYAQDMADAKMKRSRSYAAGGMVIPDDRNESDERTEEAHLMADASPSEDEGASDAMSRNETGPNRKGPALHDMSDAHSTGRKPYAMGGYAGGGKIGDDEENMDDEMEMNPAHDEHTPTDSMDQPEEEDMDHPASLAAAIMSKRKKYAKGGEVNGMDSIDTHEDADTADLSRNADEDANMEDQTSFNALRKENYSETEGLDQLDQPQDSGMKGDDEESDSHDKHDSKTVSAIRRKMKMRSPITR